MFASALSFLAGDCLVQLLPALPAPVAGFALAAVILFCLLRRWRLAAWGLFGIAWAWSHAAQRLTQDLPVVLEGQDVEISGYIASLPESTPNGPRFLLDVVPASRPTGRHGLKRVELTWYDATARPAAGELWKFETRLRRRRGFANPGGYDYEAQLFREGIGATGYVRAGDNRRIAAPAARYAVLRLRGFIADRLAAAVPGSTVLGIIQGLAVGEQQQVTPEQWQVFAATGTSHLLAISGLHVAMVAALSAALGGVAVRLPRMQQRKFSASDGRAIGCMTGALLYTALAGFGVPAQRTLVMLCIYCGARLARRELNASQGFALSLFAVLAIEPLAPLSVGAWLSFGAVGAILWLLTGQVAVRLRRRRVAELLEFLKVQWAVTIGLLPLLIAAFGSVSLVAPLVNLVAIPFFTLLVVPAVLAGAGAMVVYAPVGQALLAAVAWLLESAWPVLAACASFDHSVWHLAEAPQWAGILLVLGAGIVIAPGFLATRLTGILLCLPAFLWRPEPVAEGEFRLTLLDVGQGLAAVVQTHSRTLLYDAGPRFQNGRDTGEMVVLPFLHSRGIRRIDTTMVSHGDLDHAGGMASVLKGIKVSEVLGSPSVHLDIQPTPCVRGMHWQWEGVEFAVLHPGPDEAKQSDNDASCVLSIRGTGGSALLLGDIERAAERELVDAGLVRPADIVVAAHHGSRTSSTVPLVEAAQARYVLFATGYRNRWGFPRPDVVARWNDSGAETLSTATAGAIEFRVALSGTPPPRAYRHQYKRYWHVDEPGGKE